MDLSYSTLSPESLGRLWSLQPERRLKAEEEYIAAAELIQRVHPDIIEEDEYFTKLLEDQLKHFIQLTVDVYNAATHLNLAIEDGTLKKLPQLHV